MWDSNPRILSKFNYNYEYFSDHLNETFDHDKTFHNDLDDDRNDLDNNFDLEKNVSTSVGKNKK